MPKFGFPQVALMVWTLPRWIPFKAGRFFEHGAGKNPVGISMSHPKSNDSMWLISDLQAICGIVFLWAPASLAQHHPLKSSVLCQVVNEKWWPCVAAVSRHPGVWGCGHWHHIERWPTTFTIDDNHEQEGRVLTLRTTWANRVSISNRTVHSILKMQG